MCHVCDKKNEHLQHDSRKRSFMKLVAASALGLGISGAGVARAEETKAPLTPSTKVPPQPENVLTPDQALERLMEGNKRHGSGQSIAALDIHTSQDALVKGQNPYAAILGCADSRVGPEQCFDEAHGDLFVARVAGNYITVDFLATLEYAVAVLHTPLIMVLGHESCGAVGAAIDAIDNNKQFPGHIQAMATALAPAVRAARTMPGMLYDNTVKMNVILTVTELKNSTPILSRSVREKKIRIVGGVYRLGTGMVELVS
ncbi:carbonic anhydrase [Nitrosospira sp. NpAV]|nr:carbonic anhydrase [Nitrosospira sp. NpAV]